MRYDRVTQLKDGLELCCERLFQLLCLVTRDCLLAEVEDLFRQKLQDI